MTVSTRVFAAACRRPGTVLPAGDVRFAVGYRWPDRSLLSRAASLPAISVATYRLAVGGALIVGLPHGDRQAMAGLPGRVEPHRRNRNAGRNLPSCYFTAVSLTSVSLATLLHHWLRPGHGAGRGPGDRPAQDGRRTAGTTCLALAGLGLLVGLPAGGSPRQRCWPARAWRCSRPGVRCPHAIGARPVAGLDDLTATGFGFSIGGLALLPLAATLGGLSFKPGPATLGLMLALGTGPTAVAYTLYFRGLRDRHRQHGGAADAARTTHRCGPRGPDPRGPARVAAEWRRGHARGSRDAHGANARRASQLPA